MVDRLWEQNYWRLIVIFMSNIKPKPDCYQILAYNEYFFASTDVSTVVNNTMVKVLRGIKMAAITGASNPCTA